MEQGTTIFGLIFGSVILIYIFIKTRHLYQNDDKIRESIIQYYENKGLIVIDVYNLNIKERIKYGVPLIPIFGLYSYYFGFMSGKIDYVRKVDVIDNNDNDYTKYIELQIQGHDRISLKEFE
jgi:hypothetical protein